MNNMAILKSFFLSAYKDFEYAKKALIFGVKDYIVKPTKYKDLLNVFVKIKSELDKEEVVKEQDRTVKDTMIDDTSYHDKMIITIKNMTKKQLSECNTSICSREGQYEFFLSQ